MADASGVVVFVLHGLGAGIDVVVSGVSLHGLLLGLVSLSVLFSYMALLLGMI